ncbi:MAG: hypothetical protein ACXVB4_09170 [Pseudobdellovibrionaceae bacterium]
MKYLNKILILLIAGMLTSQVSQAIKGIKKSNQAEVQPIKIQVIYGEKISLFSIFKVRDKGLVEFSNNLGVKGSKDISLKDYNFLKNKILKISGLSNDKNFCIRNYIEISIKDQELVGCIGAPNSFAREVLETTNLVSILF